jgi:septal ring factor EnvC (AmiA/AmiB activator)
MKRFILLSIFAIVFSSSFSESIDSLKATREKLYQKYSNINIPGKELNKSDNEKSVLILKDLVIVDTKIIKEFAEFNQKTKEYDAKITSLNNENNSLSKEITANTDMLFIIYIASGTLVLLLVFAIIMLFIYMSKFSNLKKKVKDYSDLAKDADNNRLKLQQLEASIKSNENLLMEKEAVLKTLQNDKSNLEKKILDYESKLSEGLKNPVVIAPEINMQNEKLNANMQKIEKLGRMKELGIVTEEEFNTFKQKFLSEL